MKFRGVFPAHPRNLQQVSVKEFAWWPTQLSNNDWVWLETYTSIYEWQESLAIFLNLYVKPEWVLLARTQ
jgi:hypothetical protein